jgi:hypothetical protein
MKGATPQLPPLPTCSFSAFIVIVLMIMSPPPVFFLAIGSLMSVFHILVMAFPNPLLVVNLFPGVPPVIVVVIGVVSSTMLFRATCAG